MPKKSKPKKAPAKPRRPRRQFVKLRALFSKPGVALSIDQIATALGNQKHSACAAISVLGNPKHQDDPLRINLDRKTMKYSVAPGQAPAPKQHKQGTKQGTKPKAEPVAAAAG